MEYSIHTDLAIEASAVENLSDKSKTNSGISSDTFTKNDITITEVNITNENGAKAVGKPIGKYITLEVPKLRDDITEVFDNTQKALTDELKKIIEKSLNHL